MENSVRKWAAWLGYGGMILLAIGLFLVIRARGEVLAAPAPATGTAFGAHGSSAHANTLLQVLVALATIIAASRLLGALFRHFHQPPVIGEVVAGILLGP